MGPLDWAVASGVATVAGVLTAILGVLIAVAAAINYGLLESRAKQASERAAAEVAQAMQRDLAAAVEATTEWTRMLLTLDPEQVERTGRHAIELFAGIKDVLIAVATRYIHQACEGYQPTAFHPVQVRATFRDEVEHAMAVLSEALSRPSEEKAEANYLLAKCHAMVREPLAALRFFKTAYDIDNAGVSEALQADGTFFTGMDPSGETFERVLQAGLGQQYPFTDDAIANHLAAGSFRSARSVMAREPQAGFPVKVTAAFGHPPGAINVCITEMLPAIGWSVAQVTHESPDARSLVEWLKSIGYSVTFILVEDTGFPLPWDGTRRRRGVEDPGSSEGGDTPKAPEA